MFLYKTELGPRYQYVFEACEYPPIAFRTKAEVKSASWMVM